MDISYILTSLSSNIPPYFLPLPEVEEGSYDNRYFGLGDLGVQDGVRDLSVLGVKTINAQR